MKCICVRQCVIRLSEFIDNFADKDLQKFFDEGTIYPFDKCPPHFEEMLSRDVNWETANRAELMEAKWKPSELIDAAKTLYNAEIIKEEGDSKADLVKRFLDVRYRAVN